MFLNEIAEILKQFFSIFLNISLRNILDILIITFIFYKLIGIIKDTKAEQLFKGFAFILIAMKISEIFGFVALTWIIETTLNFGVIAFIVIFQPEFRKILEHLGQTTLTSRKRSTTDDTTNMINNIERAVFELSKTKTGALIILSRQYNLSDYYKKGTPLDAVVTYALLINSFVDGTPLHDGALIIQDNRVKAGNCVLPLTEQTISNDYGTRHRAAIGISEQCDAVSIVVSEETGTISICTNGVLVKYDDRIKFRAALTELLTIDEDYTIKEKGVKIWETLVKGK